MSAMSDYLENKVIDAIFRGQALPGNLSNTWIGLFTAPLNDANTGVGVSTYEISNVATGYARVQMTSNLNTWMGTNYTPTIASAGQNGTVTNNVTITFPSPTGNWGVANSFGILDANVGGNLLFYGLLTQAKTINAGDAAPSFAANTLSIQIDN